MRRRIKPPHLNLKNQKATAQWFKNVSKSLGYITTGAFIDLAPGISSTLESGRNVAETYTDPVKTFLSKNTSMSQRVDMILGPDSTYTDIAKDAFKNIREDLRTGNFNNRKREEKAQNEAFGFGDLDGFDVDMDFGDMGDGSFDDADSEGKTIVSPNINITSNITKDNPMVRAVESQIDVTIKTAQAEEKRANAIAKINFGFLESMNGNIVTGLSTINANLSNMINFNTSVVARSIMTQTNFYESGLKFMENMLAEVKKITEPKSVKPANKKKINDVNDIFMYGQQFDFEGYIAQIKKNIKNMGSDSAAGSMAGMLSPEMLKTMAANPIGTIIKTIIPSIIPEDLTKVIGRFDDALMAFLPAVTKKLSEWGRSTADEGILGILKTNIGKILGVNVDRKEMIDLGRYERGAIPFDGITKKAITEVIPGFLSKILSVISKSDPIAFDYKSGKYKSVKKIKDDFYEDSRFAIKSDFDYEVRNTVQDSIRAKYGENSDLIRKWDDALVKLAASNDLIDVRRSDGRGLDAIFNDNINENNKLIRKNAITPEEKAFLQTIFDGIRANNPTNMVKFFGMQQMNAGQRYSKIIDNLESNEIEKASVIFNGLFDEVRRSGSNSGGSGGGPTPFGPSLPPGFVDPHEEEKREARRLDYVLEQLRQGHDVPAGFSDVVLNDEARELIRKNDEKKHGKLKLFKSDNPITKLIAPLLEKPIEFLNRQATKLETVLHDIIFGPVEGEERDSNEPLIVRLKNRITSFIDDVKDKLFGDDGLFTKIKESEWYRNITDKVRNAKNKISDYLFGIKDATTGLYSSGMFSDAFNSFKGSVKSGWQTAKDSAKGVGTTLAGVFGATDLKGLMTSGLSYIGGGFKSLSDSLFGLRKDDGTVDTEETKSKLFSFLKDNLGDALGKGMVGAGLGAFASVSATGLLSGLVLGPIGGAVIGIAGSLLSKSKTFMNFLFGHEDSNTGEHIEGFISKKTQEFFKNNKKTLVGGTLIGTGLGGFGLLPGFILGGPIGGAITGLAGGILYKSEAFQNFMFGEDGALARLKSGLGGKLPDLKKILPTALAGSIGGAGIVGLLGLNPLLGAFAGAGLGIATKSKKWSTFMFGDPDDNGSHGLAGKVVGFIGDKVIDPITVGIKSLGNKISDWFDNSVKLPIMNTIDYGVEGIKLLFSKFQDTSPGSFLMDKVINPIKNVFTSLGKGLYKFTTGLLKNSIGIVGKVLGKVVSAPINLIEKLTVGVVKHFFQSSVLKEIRAPFINMLDTFKQKTTDLLDDFKTQVKHGFGRVVNAVKNLGSTIKDKLLGKLIDKVSGDNSPIDRFKQWREDRNEKTKQKVLARIDDIRAGRSSIRDGKRTGFEKFNDFADTFNPFSSLRKYAGYGNYDEDGNSILDKLGARSKKRQEEADKKKAEREEALSVLKDKVKNEPFKEKFFKRNIKGYNKMTDAEKATVKTMTEINIDTSNIADNEKETVSILQQIRDFLYGKEPSTTPTPGSNVTEIDIDTTNNEEEPKPDNKPKKKRIKRFFRKILYGDRYADEKEAVEEASDEEKTPTVHTASPDDADNEKDTKGSSKVASGVEKGFGKLLNSGPLKKLGPLIGAMSKLILPLASKAILIGVGILAIINFFRDPASFFKEAATMIGDVIAPILSGVGESIATSITDALPWGNTMKNAGEKIYNLFNDDSENNVFGPNYQEGATLEENRKALDEYKAANQAAKDAGLIYDKRYITSTVVDEGTSNAVGANNISSNKTVGVHTNEGILTSQANHLFGGSASTAEVLNEYARRGLATSESISGSSSLDKVLNVLGGTLGTGNVGLSDATFGTDTSTMNDLAKYTKSVSENSRTVSIESYWQTDSGADKFGGLGKILFKIARMAALPGRLISDTLTNVDNNVVDPVAEQTEQQSQSTIEKIGEGIGSFAKSIWDKTKSIFGVETETGSTGSTEVSNVAQLNPNLVNSLAKGTGSGGGEVNIGTGKNNYYEFPSNSVGLSDVNYNRTINGSSSPHKGVDMLVSDRANKIVKSTTNGVVVYTGTSPVYGNMVQIRDENGMYHMYGHLSTVTVQKGQSISVGSSLGIEGSTGESTGSHVHYEVGTGYTPGDHLSGRVHPAEYVKSYSDGDSVIKATPIDVYKTGSYWTGVGNTRADSFRAGPVTTDTTAGTSSSTDTALSFTSFLQPFTEFSSTLSGITSQFLGTGSGSSGSYSSSSSSGSSASGTVDTSGAMLGDFVKEFESGSEGSKTISTGSGDYGGASFGTYQLASKFPSLANFWNTYYKDKYPGVTPGDNQSFKNAWLEAANADPAGFFNNEHQFMYANYYTPFVNNSKNKDVIDPNSHSRASQEIAWSTALQYGPGSSVWRKAISNAGLSASVTPTDLIDAVQDYKQNTVSDYFGKNSAEMQEGVKYRHNTRERAALHAIGDAPAMAVGGGEIGSRDRFEIENVGGKDTVIPASSNTKEIVQILKTIVTTLISIDSSTKTTSENTSSIATATSTTTTASTQQKATSSRNASLDVAEQRRKEKYKNDYDIARTIARGY